MFHSRILLIAVIATACLTWATQDAAAQRTYIGSTPNDPIYTPYGGAYSYGPRYTYIVPPRVVVGGSPYPSRTVINSATRGTVIEYTHNGNGYISTPGSSYQTVISNGPSIFPYTTVAQPFQPPVTIETRPTQTTAKSFSGRPSTNPQTPQPISGQSEIVLICPKESRYPLSYMLNGTTYTIKPGYSQTFADDRRWTIEFLRSGNDSEIVRYDLKAGTFRFTADENGWDLKQYPAPASNIEIPPSPAPHDVPSSIPAPAPSPGL